MPRAADRPGADRPRADRPVSRKRHQDRAIAGEMIGGIPPAVPVLLCHRNETSRRIEQLRALAQLHGQPFAPVERLLQHPRLQLGNGIHCGRDGRRWTFNQLRSHKRHVYWQHNQQTLGDRSELQTRWGNGTLLGEVRIWDLLQLLHFTVDHTDTVLLYTSQFVHALQVFAGVTAYDFRRWPFDAWWQRDMQLAALVHDLGKLLSLFGERDWNVDCMNRVI